jgi:hypothetical protein
MSSDPDRVLRLARAALNEVYARLPELDCKGLSQASCGPLEVSRLENNVMNEVADQAGPFKRSPMENARPLLKVSGRCVIYESRPLIWRLWGIVDNPPKRCPWGCRPKPRYLTDREAMGNQQAVEEQGQWQFTHIAGDRRTNR